MRFRRNRTRPSRRRGIVSVWLAFALVTLIGFMALALDTSEVLAVKEQMQKGCDAAALAAATGYDDIYSSAWLYYANNALPGVDTSPTVTSDHVYTLGDNTLTITTPYSDAHTAALGCDSADCIQIVATRRVKSMFGAVLGQPYRMVTARAVAWRHLVAGGLPAIFGRHSGPSPAGFKWGGTGGVTEGDIIVNGAVSFIGSDHICHGDVIYGYGYVMSGNGNYADHWRKEPGYRDYPISAPDVSVDDFEPFDYVIDGGYKLTAGDVTIPPGTYYVEGDVSISANIVNAIGVTFVATGTISVSTSSSTFTAARNGILFYSLDSTDPVSINVSGSNSTFRGSFFSTGKISLSGSNTTVTTDRTDVLMYSSLTTSNDAIDISGSGASFTGTCFAPNGGIDYSGNCQHVMRGSLVADHVDSTGSGFTIIPQSTGSYARMAGKLVE